MYSWRSLKTTVLAVVGEGLVSAVVEVLLEGVREGFVGTDVVEDTTSVASVLEVWKILGMPYHWPAIL